MYKSKSTYDAARSIHDMCQRLKLTDLDETQRRLVKDIDIEAFHIYTNPKVKL